MKLRLKSLETRETLKLELANTATLHDLRRRVHPTMANHVHFSLNSKDELLTPSPTVDTLRSLGVTSGDLIYYSLNRSAFVASVQCGESSNWELGIPASQSETNQAIVHDSMGIGFASVQAKVDLNSGVKVRNDGFSGDNSGKEGTEPMDVEQKRPAGRIKRLSEPFLLQKTFLEKSGDPSSLTTLALAVHAIMLESGFVLSDSGSHKFNFPKEILSVSLRYSLPGLIKIKKSNYVTVRFMNLGSVVRVYGKLGESSGRLHMTCLNKCRFLRIINWVMDTLKFEKQLSCSSYRDVFVLWRMVKDDLVFPLLIDLCDKAGLESPPCLMSLPTEIKRKILESLRGVSIGNLACVCKEMRNLASDGDLWKQKYVEESLGRYRTLTGEVNWKNAYAEFYRNKRRPNPLITRNFSRRSNTRFSHPRLQFAYYGEERLYESIGVHPRQPSRAWGHRVGRRCNLEDRH